MNLDRKVMAYAAGAVATGVGAAQSADAAIVVRPGFNFGVDSTTKIDFDNNGVEEFNLGHERDTAGNADTDRLILKDKTGGGIDGFVIDPDNTGNIQVVPLAAGTLIGPDSTYGQSFNDNVGNRIVDQDADNNDALDDDTLDPGRATNFRVDNVVGNPQFLGVRFSLNDSGEERFGYIGIDITNAADLTGVVTGFAYDDEGLPIAAGAVPEPTSGLALLAMGAAGLLRRKRA